MPLHVGVVIPDFGKSAPTTHDPGGELLKIGLEGVACLMKAMDAEGEDRHWLFERCLELRLREDEGWLAVRTPEHPAGDRKGAAKAASGIGNSVPQDVEHRVGARVVAARVGRVPAGKKKTTETRAAASVTTPLRLCLRRGV